MPETESMESRVVVVPEVLVVAARSVGVAAKIELPPFAFEFFRWQLTLHHRHLHIEIESMKHLFLLILASTVALTDVAAQRFGHLDAQGILLTLPERAELKLRLRLLPRVRNGSDPHAFRVGDQIRGLPSQSGNVAGCHSPTKGRDCSNWTRVCKSLEPRFKTIWPKWSSSSSRP